MSRVLAVGIQKTDTGKDYVVWAQKGGRRSVALIRPKGTTQRADLMADIATVEAGLPVNRDPGPPAP